MPNKHETIVKVQIPLFTITDGDTADVLVYSQDRTMEFALETDSTELRRIKKAMKDKDKAFFYACTHCEQVNFDRSAPDQNW